MPYWCYGCWPPGGKNKIDPIVQSYIVPYGISVIQQRLWKCVSYYDPISGIIMPWLYSIQGIRGVLLSSRSGDAILDDTLIGGNQIGGICTQ